MSLQQNHVSKENQDNNNVRTEEFQNKNNVPELRFPEFSDEWHNKNLSEICSIKGRIGFRGYNKSDLVKKGEGAITLGGKNINEENKLDLTDIDYLSWKKYYESPEIMINKGDIILAQRGTLGKSALINKYIKYATINPSMVLLKNFKINNKFLHYMLTTKKLIKSLLKKSSSTAVPMINQKEIGKLNISFPSLKEQEKIAQFLSLVDEKIELMEKTLVLYQRLVYKIKCDYFDNMDSFCLIKLKDLIKKGKAGGTPKSSIKKYYGGNIPFLSISDMTKQGKYIYQTEKTITEEGLNNSSTWLVPENSILYSFYASIGNVALNKIPLTTSQAIYSIIPNRKVDLHYLYHFLNNFKREVHRYIETGTQGNLNANIIKNIKIKLPSLEKQKYYSYFFDLMDKNIQLKKQEYEKIKEFKKGLLQKLFI